MQAGLLREKALFLLLFAIYYLTGVPSDNRLSSGVIRSTQAGCRTLRAYAVRILIKNAAGRSSCGQPQWLKAIWTGFCSLVHASNVICQAPILPPEFRRE
jgi:hypothetical protein